MFCCPVDPLQYAEYSPLITVDSNAYIEVN